MRLDQLHETAEVLPLRERREATAARMLGRLVSLNGMQGIVASRLAPDTLDQWSIGHLITIKHGAARLVGVVCEIAAEGHLWNESEGNIAHIKIELSGEINDDENGQPRFFRGIRSYPELGALTHRIRARDLAAIYAFSGRAGIEIGKLSQDESIPAVVSVKELVSRHFAVIGSTGVGKTTSVCTLIHRCIGGRPNLRVLIVDPHNEYANHFPDHSIVLDSTNLEIPFWMFKFEEMLDIIYTGRKPSADEIDALYDVIKTAKARFAGPQAAAAAAPSAIRRAPGPETAQVSADSPLPYRIGDALKILDEWMGLLDKRFSITDLRALRNRLEALARDPRYKFMFGKTLIEDNMAKVVSRIFRIPMEGLPVTIVQLAGLPNEVVNSVVSVLARMSFDISFWGGGAYEIVMVCEEAHRYIPNDLSLGFGPTRTAIGRIAKEGRKYGASLAIVSQRPSELDATILSQCSSMFAMRLPNDMDKAIIKSALAESSASIVSFLSSIADREAIAFGEAIPTPMRMKFAVPTHRMASAAPGSETAAEAARLEQSDLLKMVGRLRGEYGGE